MSLGFSLPGTQTYRGCVKRTQREYIATEKKWLKSKTGSGVRLENFGRHSKEVIVTIVINNYGLASEGWMETHPESNETGPWMHSPPRSKYLKHPVRRMARYSSVAPHVRTEGSE